MTWRSASSAFRLKIATGPRAERDLRERLERHPDAAVRERGLAALDRLEAARDALAAAAPEQLRDALAALDDVFGSSKASRRSC